MYTNNQEKRLIKKLIVQVILKKITKDFEEEVTVDEWCNEIDQLFEKMSVRFPDVKQEFELEKEIYDEVLKRLKSIITIGNADKESK